ncbi:hypothetical protein [Bradyrhizobium sp. SEMIA]|uniref:hypothetical protein n=1 Tax=Bradyrhizobium sp. SEMIA TaxID=2597515 RepID=UPI0018A4DD3E|nr:hypothetical protein [Bradyrhizobium sp. SEMIA]QOG17995.1 hypothetical protein FOM02_12210 [Bradyrhizobium sp. SEMIA]
MRQAKQTSKRKKRVTKVAVPAFGAAGLTFSLAGGASASAVPTPDVQQLPHLGTGQAITLDDEEMADVSLATFHLFDKENAGSRVQLAWRGCGGCAAAEAVGVAVVADVASVADVQVAQLAVLSVWWDAPYHARVAAHRGAAAAGARPRRAPNVKFTG